ncbi:hypothetical protein VPH35_123807 [Triticum aestivum]
MIRRRSISRRHHQQRSRAGRRRRAALCFLCFLLCSSAPTGSTTKLFNSTTRSIRSSAAAVSVGMGVLLAAPAHRRRPSYPYPSAAATTRRPRHSAAAAHHRQHQHHHHHHPRHHSNNTPRACRHLGARTTSATSTRTWSHGERRGSRETRWSAPGPMRSSGSWWSPGAPTWRSIADRFRRGISSRSGASSSCSPATPAACRTSTSCSAPATFPCCAPPTTPTIPPRRRSSATARTGRSWPSSGPTGPSGAGLRSTFGHGGALTEDFVRENGRLSWPDREPYAFWKGNPDVSPVRRDLFRCNNDSAAGKEWNVRAFKQDWKAAHRNGFRDSDLAKQCRYRYKIYVQGRAWSVSEKYILACDSPMLAIDTPFEDFFTRGLVAGKHYWPIDPARKCAAIKFAVDWGNAHPGQARRMGEEGSGFAREEMSMDYVYEYMLHALTQYSALLRYKPTVPEKAVEVCVESMACPRRGREREFMMESRERYVAGRELCTLPPPFTAEEVREMAVRDEQVRSKILQMEEGH